MKRAIVVCSLLICTPANAARVPLPASQWTADAHLWLSRAMVAEAGWRSDRDHVAIAYVLARRWHRAKLRFATLRFVDIVRNYCAGLGDYRRSLTPRQQWLRGLGFLPARPEAWPRKVSWERHEPLWRAALLRSQRWSLGKLKDPCRGRALHWGGTIDSPHGRMTPVDCGETRNTFYGLRK